MYTYNAKVIRLVDADTMDLEVDLGFYMKATMRFRVSNYDAPESWRPKSEEEANHARQANEFAQKLFENPNIMIHSKRDGKVGIYGRWACDIMLPDGRDYVTVMKEAGFEKLSNYT